MTARMISLRGIVGRAAYQRRLNMAVQSIETMYYADFAVVDFCFVCFTPTQPSVGLESRPRAARAECRKRNRGEGPCRRAFC